MFTIRYTEGFANELAILRAFDRKWLLDRIEDLLTHQPSEENRNRKMVIGLVPPWEHKVPVWELRVRGFRVYYDVDEETAQVTIRAVRRKPPHKTTEETL
jgi:mRNA-degrading endonuclease RelE of RelBE toxin-antitoxin system